MNYKTLAERVIERLHSLHPYATKKDLHGKRVNAMLRISGMWVTGTKGTLDFRWEAWPDRKLAIQAANEANKGNLYVQDDTGHFYRIIFMGIEPVGFIPEGGVQPPPYWKDYVVMATEQGYVYVGPKGGKKELPLEQAEAQRLRGAKLDFSKII